MDKVYSPEEIKDAPFPEEETSSNAVSQSSSGGVYGQNVIQDKPLPVRKTAHELIGSALNTKSRKILAEFEFTEHGAIQIGKYTNGVSGDIRITPSGIVARDISGLTTFALDGDTGSAYFKGTVQAGSIISESELIGGSININDRFTVDADGNVSITQGNIALGTGDVTIGGDSINTNAQIFSHLTGETEKEGVTSYQWWYYSLFKIDGDNFNNQNVYFEAVMGNGLAGDQCWARIYNITSGSELSGSEITSTSETPELVRSGALTFPSGEKTYRLEAKVNDGDAIGVFSLARLVHIQQ